MSGSTVRKVQPFTISTKLSLPKCAADCPGDPCPDVAMAALDNRGLRHNLNERVSLYLAQSQAAPGPPEGRVQSTSPMEEGVTDEDRLNRNSLARSIKKITLSNWHGEPGPGEDGVARDPAHASCQRNHNNNNSRPGKAPFKLSGSHAAAPWKESIKTKEPGGMAWLKTGLRNSTGQANPNLTPLLAQFNQEIMQAENWVQGKLRDLKDGCEIQDWERVAQNLQRDMKDFENALIKLNQMGEQLMGWPSPSVETVRRQLLALREQWQLLKQTASNQSKALGGLRSLQEFNTKAEQLEAWIRQKEEKPMLAALLQQSLDKIQLTRRILDLKQEEQRFHGLHEEMNTLAQRLEKQGRSESRSISARRKHLNKMWLRLQGTLKEHHETLQLALEAAAFIQQADMLLKAIHAKWRSLYGVGKQGEADPSREQDVRDIASQVMILDVTVSQLISLHPSLVARVTHKHRDVKESWARLQEVLRNEKSPVQSLTSSSPREALSPEQTGGSSEGVAGNEAGDKKKRVPGNEVQKDVSGSVTEHVRGEEGSPGLPGGHLAQGCHSSKRRKLPGHSDAGWGVPQQESQLQNYCQAANMAISWLKEGAGPGIQQNQVEDAENLEALQSHQEILGNSTGLEAVCQEGQKLFHTCPRGSPEVEGVLRELVGLWEELQRKHQENGAVLREIDKALQLVGELDRAEHWLQGVAGSLSEPAAMKNPEELRRDLQDIGSLENQLLLWGIRLQALREEMGREPSTGHEAAGRIQRKVETVEEKLRCVRAALRRRASDLRDSLVLSEFLQNVQQEEVLSQKSRVQPVTHQLDPKEPLHLLLVQAGQQLNREGMSSPLGELQEAVEMLNDAVKERERVMEAAAETESLERLLAEVSLHMQAVRCRAETLARDIAQAERGFATVKSEWDLQGLQGLLSRQQDMEVSAYLCVKENEGVGSATHKSSTVLHPAKQAPARSHASLVSSTGADTAFHTLPKASSSSLMDSLQRGRKAVVEGAQPPWQQRLLTAEPSQLQPWSEEKHNPSNTWPLKCERRKVAGRASSPRLGELGEEPPGRASNAECSTIKAASSGPKAEDLSHSLGPSSSQPATSKGPCQHLSLGSVLSLELPKDLGLLRNVQDSIKIAWKEVAERKKGQQPCGVIQWEVKGPELEVNNASLSKEMLSHQLTTCPRPGGSIEPSRKALKSEHSTWFEEVSFNPGYDRQKTQSVAAASSREDGQSLQVQGSSSGDFLDFQVHQLSRISMLREQAGQEWNQLTAMLGKPGSPGRVQPEKPVDLKPQVREATRVELRPSPTKLSSGALVRGEPPRESTKLKEVTLESKLEAAPVSKASEESPVRLPGGGTDPFPLINLDLRATPQLSVLEYDLSYPQQSLASASAGPQDLASAGHMMGLGLSKEAKPPGSVEVCHPDHELFEKDEEELQAIWSSVGGHSRQSPRADPSMCPTMGNGSDEVQNPDVSNRKLILTSENNVLVAKFMLPASAQLLCNPQTGRGTGEGHKTEGSPSGFWASLPSQEGHHGVKEVVSLGSVEGTGPQNRQKHQEEDRDLGKTPHSKMEFQMMEGALERKHVLQTGGRKANYRTWSLFHTVLMRQTLCFYQDRKDTLKSSVVALPLNLSGARCTQDMEYTKKTNCFRLHLRDGSEYLLRAPSQPLMNEWVSKLQQNSGFPEVDYFQAAVQPAEGTSSPISSSHLQGHHQPVTAKSQEITLLPRSSARMHLPFGNREDLQDSAASLAGDSQRANSQMTGHRRFQWSPTGSPRSRDANYQEEDYALVTNKRRSYSFTSATYQKITPVSVPKEPLEPGSSYSITLYIGEQAMPRARCHSFVATPGSPREVLGERGQGPPPRPKNKSVFKKFFGKKE
ncbi:uncharacterized protein LOC102559868 isoform X9 [Alligator mississippiensis]|uniref:uncharacterized protein LOC102559868 isoform X9 n=1 Tax=Alligator mississippiensis TaxID=8496 RepID=UPI0009070386|nr:uncharacterized protein LOC102559868 isoform X9 [Alligator mississippiensis]